MKRVMWVIIAAREGNYPGGATPTPDTVIFPAPTSTPYPPNYWRESALIKVQPDGATSIFAQGGKLNPSDIWNNSIWEVECDALGNIFVLNEDYLPPAPTPGPYTALLKVAPDGAVTEFASGGIMDEQWLAGAIAVSADGELFMVQEIGALPPYTFPGTPTPAPARIIKADAAGALSVVATTASGAGAPIPSPPAPAGTMLWWSEPFEFTWGIDFDFQGRLLVGGGYFTDYFTMIGFSQNGVRMSIQALNPDGTFTTVVDGATNGNLLGQSGLCFDGEGTLVGADDASLYRLDEGANISFIHSGAPFVWIDDLKFYPSANPPFGTWFSDSGSSFRRRRAERSSCSTRTRRRTDSRC
ncbi:MAG: hypothetical protein NT045_05625 [Candidatus Aureabacteria bacterium]|nr:hypothetical protein [Candidatus Auribacterota bacterium]